MHEDYSYEGDGPMGDGPRLAPIEISDLLGNSISAQILRNMLDTGPNGIWNEFGIDAESAATMLVCCELAELTAWDRDALLQAATLWGWADCPLACGGITAQSAARKIDLELKRGKHPEIFSHAEGIRFLDGLGLKVFPQLIEAVACFQEMTHNEQGGPDITSEQSEKQQHPTYFQPAQEEAILSAIRDLGYAPTTLPKPPAGKPGVKAKVRSELKNNPLFKHKNTVFDKAWERLRSNGEISDA